MTTININNAALDSATPDHIDERQAAGIAPLAAAPASFAQESLWLLHELYPDSSTAYNLKTAYILRGDLDLCALRLSFEQLVRRHEALRTTFCAVGGEPLQFVQQAGDFPLPIVDLRDGPVMERSDLLDECLRAEGARPFDLQRGPLLRATLFRLGLEEHVLLIVMHHMIFDDGSLPVFNRELTTLYRAFHLGTPANLAALPIQYPDFALWQRESTQTAQSARQLAYWLTQLADIPPRIELPLDRPRPAIPRFVGAVRTVSVSAELSGRIRALAQANRATIFMTLLAAFNVLLYRYTGQRDLVVGSPIANRARTELEDLIGFFVDSVALRTKLGGESTFVDILRQVRETTLAAFDNTETPFEHVVAALQPERTVNSAPLLNVRFFVRSHLGDPLALDGLELERVPIASTRSKVDLSLRVTELPGGLLCSLQYDTDLFDAAKIERLLVHFVNLLESITAAPDRPIAALAMLGSAERERLLVEWNATATTYADDRTLAALFESTSVRTPDAVAVNAGDDYVSYRELNARSNRLAHELRANGLSRGDVVGICIGRSIDTIVSALAVLKAGGAYLPLDADYPPERLRHMLSDSGARHVLTTDNGFPEILHGPGVAVIDAAAPGLAERSSANIAPVSHPDDVVAVMYTSGSTGRPKGVPIPGKAVLRLVTGTKYIAFNELDVVAQVSNFSFDAATFEIWGALLNGARLEIIAREVILAPAAFASALRKRRVSVMFLTSALFRYMVGVVPAAFAQLRCLLVGGEIVDPAAARTVLEKGPPGRLINGYGPTEATTFACTYDITLPVQASIPIGRPISNTEAYILDADCNPLPPGVPGQLYLGGPGLALGYLNAPELTARKFVAHPFSAIEGARLYATGDVAQYHDDGNIEYIGRIDRQVKVRGFRIEIDEIEASLTALSGIRSALVQVQSAEFGEKRIVAYVIDDEQRGWTLETWRARLRQTLPDYMLPNAVLTLAAFPLTANGKIDYDKLPGPQSQDTSTRPAQITDPRLHALIGLWNDLLGIVASGTRDNFFDLGGHSLLATRMIAEVTKMFGRRVSIAAFLANPTIEYLANLLLAEGESGSHSPLIKLRGTGTKPPFFFMYGALRGGGYYIHKLARGIDESQPFYVLPPHGFDDRPVPASIEEMASDYARVIREAQPHGPYALGGYCQGGLVALEIARRLRAANETVSSLILIDSAGVNGRCAKIADLLDRAAAALHLSERSRIGLRTPFGRISTLWGDAELFVMRAKRLVMGARRGRVAAYFGRRAPQAPIEEYRRFRAYLRVVAKYVPLSYDGPITLLFPQDDMPERSQHLAGWRCVSPTVSVETVPGTHSTCITTFANETATRIGEHLKNAQS